MLLSKSAYVGVMVLLSTGVRFFFRQYARGIGGILADDMGAMHATSCCLHIPAPTHCNI